jgi:hypothetical protein
VLGGQQIGGCDGLSLGCIDGPRPFSSSSGGAFSLLGHWCHGLPQSLRYMLAGWGWPGSLCLLPAGS